MHFEIEIIKALQSGRSDFWDFFFKYYSYIATIFTVFVIAAILFLCKKRWSAFWFLVVEGAGYCSGFILKHIISRDRPYIASSEVIAITTTDGKSMPSGHSLCAIIMALCLIYIFWENKKTWQRALMIAGGVTFFLLMGMSRMYLGQHYLSDVLVGYTLGYCVCLIAYWVRNPVARVVNMLLDSIGLGKWKMKVPPMPLAYDDMAERKIEDEVVVENTEQPKQKEKTNINKGKKIDKGN